MKKLKVKICLTAAGIIALLVGGRRLSEGAVLDPDNMTPSR